MKKLTESLEASLQSLYNGMADQYSDIDDEIASKKASIKRLAQLKKEIEADMEYLEGMGIKKLEEEIEAEVDGENQEEES